MANYYLPVLGFFALALSLAGCNKDSGKNNAAGADAIQSDEPKTNGQKVGQKEPSGVPRSSGGEDIDTGNIRVGDWVERLTTNSVRSKSTVINKASTKISLEEKSEYASSKPMLGKRDYLLSSFQKPKGPEAIYAYLENQKEIGQGAETLTIAGRTMQCRWRKWSGIQKLSPTKQYETTVTIWTSNNVPIDKIAKFTIEYDTNDTSVMKILIGTTINFGRGE